MISNPDLIYYACVAKGSVILTEFVSSKESGIEIIAQKCIEKTPLHHSYFSHTVRQKSYTFLINDPFAYFVIYHENLEKSESFWFLNRLKAAFDEFLVSSNIYFGGYDVSYNCFQSDFYPILRDILALDVDLVNSLMDVPKEVRNLSMDSTRGKRSVVRPLLSTPAKFMMKKKKRQSLGCVADGGEGNAVDNNHKGNHYVGENGNVVNREYSVLMHKNGGGNVGGFYMGDGRQKAKQMWRKHVWIVLILDLVICAVLFGIWLGVCEGFKCVER